MPGAIRTSLCDSAIVGDEVTNVKKNVTPVT
jgi:hypothetical protein